MHYYFIAQLLDGRKIRLTVSLPPLSTPILKILHGHVKNVPFCLHFSFRQPTPSRTRRPDSGHISQKCYDLILCQYGESERQTKRKHCRRRLRIFSLFGEMWNSKRQSFTSPIIAAQRHVSQTHRMRTHPSIQHSSRYLYSFNEL